MSYLGFCPPGVVMAFAGATAPEGWLLCDGTAYSQTSYPTLYAALGSTYNTQTDPTTNAAMATPGTGNFRVPNYKGAFIRGVGTPYAGDAVSLGGFQPHKTAKNGLSETAGAFTGTSAGSSLTDVGHSHGVGAGNNYAYGSGSATTWWASASGNAALTFTSATGSNSTSLNHSHSTTATGSVANGTISSTDLETRPHNVGVNYIIKI